MFVMMLLWVVVSLQQIVLAAATSPHAPVVSYALSKKPWLSMTIQRDASI
jgi:hypothetical protein